MMKRFFIATAIILASAVAATVNARSIKAVQWPVTGSVVDAAGRPVSYATVIAMQGNIQSAGTITDDNGAFALQLASGDYTLSFEFLGYKSVTRRLSVQKAEVLGEIVLEDDNINIEGVEITAQIIRREADRFVVDVANMPSAIGKDGVEVLQTSPGVFINDDKITINGQSGTKVYVNDREVRYTGDRLLNYLRNLKAEDIRKIEVVPVTGADYDADSSGGVIKITLKQKRDDGFMGSVGFRTSQNDLRQQYSPSLSLDYRRGRWTVSASGNYSYNDTRSTAEDRTVYTDSENTLYSESETNNTMQWYNGKLGAVFEVNDSHSVGAEVEYSGYNDAVPVSTYSMFRNAVPPVTDESRGEYSQNDGSQSIAARFNYIARLDTLGSTLKLLVDYTHQQSWSDNDYRTEKSTSFDGVTDRRDSLYRDNSGTDYNIATVSLSYDKVFSPKFTLKSGGKYTCNLMESFSNYDFLDNDRQVWQTRTAYNYDVNYTENIAALYVIGTAALGRWGITAGLRGEYTHTSGRNNVARQNYFSLFPNANVSFALTADRAYSLVGQYSRNIQRPGFWALNPARTQVSEYLYQTGNPDLVPGYVDNVTLTAVLKYKYSITLMSSFARDQVQQVVQSDPDQPNVNSINQENLDRIEAYGIAVNLPFQLTKWWSANVNASGRYVGTRIRKGERQEFHPMLNMSASMTFTLPRNFFITVDYYGMSRTYYSNMVLSGRHFLSASVKKRMFDDKLVLSAGVNNIIPANNDVEYSDSSFVRRFSMKEGWSRTAFTFSVSYNFNTGKKFNKRYIESDADASRLEKN